MVKIIKGKDERGVSFWRMWLRPVLSCSGEFAGLLWSLQFRSGKLANLILMYRFQLVMIDSSYIRNLENLDSEKKIILSIEPVYLLKGKPVFDASGVKLGKVFQIGQLGYQNDFDSLLVKKKLYLPALRIARSQIQTINKSIILKERV